ncbi:hypothetical protein BD769DRAFT_1385246 [Suillus cothurnatus]|nr:hypothetical protein BD769DRAFT_1385246 [Suillus cothurnatus]
MTALGLIQSTTTLTPSYTLLFLNCSRCRMMNNNTNCVVAIESALYQNSTVWVLLCQVNVRAQMFLGIANLIENDPATFYELKCNLNVFKKRWLADNLWLQGLAIVLPQVQQELDPVRVEYTVLAEFAGLTVGASTWGIMADLIGRRLSFNHAWALELAEICLLMSHQTLALLSVWWALGQSLISWGFIANFSCNPSIPDGQCPKSANMGWRYTLYILHNGRTITLELEDLQAIFGDTTSKPAPSLPTNVRNAFSGMFLCMAINTTLIIIIWGLIGITYPLFNAYLMPTSHFIFLHKVQHPECGADVRSLVCVYPRGPSGTGDALCSGLNRIGRFVAPLIKIATTPLDGSTSANMENGPVFVSATLFMVTAILTMLLPIETAGKMAL